MADPNLSGPYSFQYPPPGASSVLEYQASGLPFVTQSTATTGITQLHFTYVTKFITVKNNGPSILNVGFTSNGLLGTNKFTLPVSGTYTADIRIMDLFLNSTATTTYEVIAGLTQIPDRNFYILTGSHVGFSASSEAAALAAYNRGFGYPGI